MHENVPKNEKKAEIIVMVNTDDEAALEGDGEVSHNEKLPLKARLNHAVYVTKRKPAKNARLYFFLRASSSNAECREFIPVSLSLYKKLKGHGAEIIMLNADKNINKRCPVMGKRKPNQVSHYCSRKRSRYRHIALRPNAFHGRCY